VKPGCGRKEKVTSYHFISEEVGQEKKKFTVPMES